VVLSPLTPVSTVSYEKPICETVECLVDKYAEEYKVSKELMYKIMDCENPARDPELQSHVKYNFSDPKRGIIKGERELSWGLVQIHAPDWPEVSLEQATDAEFSIRFLAYHLSEDRGYLWSCYRQIK